MLALADHIDAAVQLFPRALRDSRLSQGSARHNDIHELSHRAFPFNRLNADWPIVKLPKAALPCTDRDLVSSAQVHPICSFKTHLAQTVETCISGKCPGGPPAAPAGPEHRVGGVVAIPGVLRARGVDPDAVLARAGLPPSSLDDPDRRVPFAVLVALLDQAVRATACPYLGLLIGAEWTISHTGPAGDLARLSETIREALETLTVYQRLNSQAGAAFLSRYGENAALGFAIVRSEQAGLATAYDVALAALANGMREMAGPGWNPSEVRLPRARPSDESPYRLFFRCPVQFDADRAALIFPSVMLDKHLATADAERKRALERRLSARGDDDLVERVTRSLRLQMLDRTVRGADLAHHFAMHRRTLDRRLRARGTTFQTVLREVRYETARQLLRDTKRPLGEIAVSIGFNEQSSFNHAFRRWSGVTPSAWRKIHAC
ncbi:MAG: AraC family transcriptional regulator [Steroidobacteraceae bacterium]